ncbi:unnamed protein product [Symbiodinium sp. CCMP2592]|nr:unnamed protein product [Symbiodinium sp. CCMP2592]
MWHLARRCSATRKYGRAVATQMPGKLLRGRPPVLLGRRERRGRDVPQESPKKASLPDSSGGIADFRKLCQAALQSSETRNSNALALLRQAGRKARTPAEAALVLNHIVDMSRDEHFIRFLVDKLVSQRLAGQNKHVCLAASALARVELWMPAFGTLVDQVFAGTHAEISLEHLSPIDVAQICRFTAVFRRHLECMGLPAKRVLEAVHLRLQHLEESGKRLEATGFISLLRSVTQMSEDPADAGSGGSGGSGATRSLAMWLRSRLVKELPLCSPRQLASALLDLGALKQLDDNTLLQLQREVTRNWRANTMRPRDLASIISGYSKLEGVSARQSAIEPLLPQMLFMMNSCSQASLCELLHGLAAANIYDRMLLDEWSSNFHMKAAAEPRTPRRAKVVFEQCSDARCWALLALTSKKILRSADAIKFLVLRAQLSLVVADLAKLRYVKKDGRNTFSTLLGRVMDVAPSLGGLSVCHIVCALARVSPARTNVSAILVDSSPAGSADFRSSLLNRLEAQLLVKVEELLPQGLSASAAAFVKLRHFSEDLLSGLTQAAVPRLGSFSAEDFSMFSSAVGTAQHALAQSWSEDHLVQLGEHAAQSLQQASTPWTPRQVSQVLQPFAAQKRPPEGLIQAAVAHLRRSSSNYSPRDLAKFLNRLQGCGVLHHNMAMAAEILQSSERRLRHRGPEIVAVANSLAQLRQVIPVSQLRYRFRKLSISVQLAMARNLLSLRDQADVLRIWALVGLRDWRLLATLATNASQELDAASTKSLAGPGQLPFPAEDLPQAIYAYAKLGSPHKVAPEYRTTILEFLVRAMKALLRVDAVPRLGEKALRQLLLGIAFWGPQPCKERPAGQEEEAEAGHLRQVLLQQSLEVWLQMESSATEEIARAVVASASLEFGVQAGDLSDAAAKRFQEVQRPAKLPLEKVSGQSVDYLRSYERSVFKALEKLLTEKFRLKPPVPKLEAMHSASCCNVRLALPALKVAVEVGLKGDLFEGPREAWADAGWGRTAESELDHGPIPGDFVAAGLDEVLEDADQRWFNLGEGEDIEASATSVPWQQLPALRIRLLRASGWKVVEIPYYDWRKLVKSEQQRFLGQLLKDAVPAFAQAKSDRTDFRFSAKTVGMSNRVAGWKPPAQTSPAIEDRKVAGLAVKRDAIACCLFARARMADKEQKEVEEMQATMAEIASESWSENSRYRCFFAAQQYYLLNANGPEEETGKGAQKLLDVLAQCREEVYKKIPKDTPASRPPAMASQ